MYTGEAPLDSARIVWTNMQSVLASAVGQNVHKSWTERLNITQADAYTVTLTAPTRFIANKIESTYAETLRRLWARHDRVAPPRRVIITSSQGQNATTPHTFAPHKAGTESTQMQVEARLSRPKLIQNTTNNPDLNPRTRYTFDNFVVGPSNEFAYAITRQIAQSGTIEFNPVIIHGANGMGKTHLLYAMKQVIEDTMPEKQTRMISGEAFVNTFVGSMMSNGRSAIDTFKATLRNTDLLMIDDAHFIASKPGSQEELMHTLVSLVNEGRQVVLVTDRHPDEIEHISPRLRSYMTSGLVCKIGPADYELRLQMLNRLIARRNANGHQALIIPDNVRDHLAARINATPRDLEGAFNQVIAQADYLGTPVTLESIQAALSDSRFTKMERLTVDKIQKVVAQAFDIALNEMSSKRRARNVARPRQVAMYLSKTLTDRSLPDIGRRFGGRDHTTVIHAVKKIKELRVQDPGFDEKIKGLESLLTV